MIRLKIVFIFFISILLPGILGSKDSEIVIDYNSVTEIDFVDYSYLGKREIIAPPIKDKTIIKKWLNAIHSSDFKSDAHYHFSVIFGYVEFQNSTGTILTLAANPEMEVVALNPSIDNGFIRDTNNKILYNIIDNYIHENNFDFYNRNQQLAEKIKEKK
jgi:hypothetical protein